MTYQYVLAEQVAEWVADKRIGKGTFEHLCHGLTWKGLAVTNAALKAITDTLPVEDFSSKDVWEDMGWREVTRTFIYCNEPLERITEVAIAGVKASGA